MTNVNNHKVRLIGAVVFLLVMVISGTIFFYVQGKSSKTSTNGDSAVSPTARRKATPEPTPTILTTPQPLFFDNFIDKSKGWYLGNTSGYSRVISDDSLTLADSNHTILTESLPTSTIFDDFMVNVTFTILQANMDDSVGIYLRGDTNLDHDYRIDIYGNN